MHINIFGGWYMRKNFFAVIPLIALVVGCAGIARPAANSPGMDLDAAIRASAAQMGENLPGGTMIALVSVASSSAQLSEYVISRLEAALVGGKRLVVVDRANLDKVREEQGFQLSGEVDDDSAKSIGKLLGAGAIVTGAFTNLGDVYSLSLKAINIETATVAVSYPADIARSTRIETMMASGGGAAGTGTRTAQTGRAAPAAVSAPPAPPAQVYKIGDTGPAGGIIFYDKLRSSNGWRYLEAAPEDIEMSFQWGGAGKWVEGTDTAVGSGKQNTEAIARFLARTGEQERAAQFCSEIEWGGYSDWFLPSKDELNLMYQNLKIKNTGGFSGDWYWSSSEYGGNIWHCAWAQRFSDGNQHYGNVENKDQVHSVRPIRAF
jgi:hypothetical protein